MFSYFKAHRRTGSTAESPRSSQWQPNTSPLGSGQSDSPLDRPPVFYSSSSEASPVSYLPPSLPPIPRVASRQEEKNRAHQPSLSDVGPHHLSSQGDLARPSPPTLPPFPQVMARKQPDLAPLRIRTADLTESSVPAQHHPPRIQLGGEDYRSPADSSPRGGYRQPVIDQHSTKAPPSASNDAASRPITPNDQVSPQNTQLQPPSGSSRTDPSPSSSMSSVQRSANSSTFRKDNSPGSSRPAQSANANASRSSKVRKNLLHPVSMLRRRRTAQGGDGAANGLNNGQSRLDVPAMSLPEDYDPRIRGKGVHDFNKPRRNYSTTDVEVLSVGHVSPVEEYRRRSSIPSAYPDDDDLGSGQGKRRKSSDRSDRDRAPVFTENFDDADGDAGSTGVNRESLANSSFIARMSRQLNFDAPEWSSTNTSSQLQQIPPADTHKTQRESKSTTGVHSVRNSSDRSTVRSSISNDTKATSPPDSPKMTPQRKSYGLEPPFQPAGLAKRLSSKGSQRSRFSFQLNSDQTVAQEKALEEKGKEKAAKKSASGSTSEGRNDGSDSDSEDESGYDDFDSGGEEDIPMIGVDDEEYNAELAKYSAPAEESTWTSESSSQPTIKPTNENSVQSPQSPSSDAQLHFQPVRNGTVTSCGTDDMYFDDGGFNEPSPSGDQKFDESLLDSPVGHTFNNPGIGGTVARSSEINGHDGLPLKHDASQQEPETIETIPDSSPSMAIADEARPEPHRLSTSNLNAYHDALASAATKAQASGKFQRQPSISTSVTGSDLGFYSHLEQDGFGNMSFDDDYLDGMEDESMISAANAEVLDSDDADYYGSEFGFYSAAHSKHGQIVNGGYFGSADEVHRSVSGRNAVREPCLTPITERSEYSRRTSFVSIHKLGSSQSIPGSAVLPSPAYPFVGPAPGLRDLAADIVAEDQADVSLDQLMRLRRQRFRSGSNTSSPSATSASPAQGPLPSYFTDSPTSHPRDDVHEDLAAYEAEEHDSYPSGWNSSRPQSIASIPPSPTSSSHPQSADTTPRPTHPAFQKQGSSSPSPRAHRFSFQQQTSSPLSTSSPVPLPTSPHLSSSPVPTPSFDQLTKFAARPPASSATYAERERDRQQRASEGSADEDIGLGDVKGPGGKGRKVSGDTSVAYVMEDGQWFYERRRKLSSGELMVVDRQVVSGGRI